MLKGTFTFTLKKNIFFLIKIPGENFIWGQLGKLIVNVLELKFNYSLTIPL